MQISPYSIPGINIKVLTRQKKDYEDLDKIAKDLLGNLPNPYNSFEKATYVIYKGKRVLYSFTTTCHNTEDAINIMIDYCSRRYSLPTFFKIWKEVKGEKELVYKNTYFSIYG